MLAIEIVTNAKAQNIAKGLSRNRTMWDHEDVLQEAASRALRKEQTAINPEALAVTCVKNVGLEMIAREETVKRGSGRNVHWDYEFDKSFASKDASLDRMERSEERAKQRKFIESMMLRLTPRQRDAIRLRFFEDLSITQVAEYLGLDYRQTCNVIHRALQAMR